MTDLPSIVDHIRERFPVLCARTQRPDLTVVATEAAEVVALLGWLKGTAGYRQLTHVSVVDWLEDGEFQLTYLVTHPDAHHTLSIQVRIDRDAASAESIHHVWPEAVTYEQEFYEMYGIRFPGSPRVGEDFMLEGWVGPPPMRRDFDTLKFSEEAFGFRPGRTHTDPKVVRAEFMAKEKAKKAAAKKEQEGGAS